MNATTATTTFCPTVPAVRFGTVTGGTRVTREGKGGHLFITHAEGRRVSYVLATGYGVAGTLYYCDREWFVVYGVGEGARWEAYATYEEAIAEAALWWLS